MAQFSPKTSSYDTIVYKVSKFFEDYYNQKFKTYEEFSVAYQKLLQEVEESNVGVTGKYNPIIKRTTT
jgi:hypothetical protein